MPVPPRRVPLVIKRVAEACRPGPADDPRGGWYELKCAPEADRGRSIAVPPTATSWLPEQYLSADDGSPATDRREALRRLVRLLEFSAEMSQLQAKDPGCVDADECAAGTYRCGTEHGVASGHATCRDTECSYDCLCQRGYSWDGTACRSADDSRPGCLSWQDELHDRITGAAFCAARGRVCSGVEDFGSSDLCRGDPTAYVGPHFCDRIFSARLGTGDERSRYGSVRWLCGVRIDALEKSLSPAGPRCAATLGRERRGCLELARQHETEGQQRLALRPYQRACRRAEAEGCLGAAMLLTVGWWRTELRPADQDEVPQDLPRAAQLLQHGCELGLAPACYELAYRCREGHGVRVDQERTRRLEDRARRLGSNEGGGLVGH